MVARRAHNPEVARSNRAPATANRMGLSSVRDDSGEVAAPATGDRINGGLSGETDDFADVAHGVRAPGTMTVSPRFPRRASSEVSVRFRPSA